MTKEQFYQQRDDKVRNDFQALRNEKTARDAIDIVAEMNELTASVVSTIIYPRTYRMKNKKTS